QYGTLTINGIKMEFGTGAPITFTVPDISALKISYTNTDNRVTSDSFDFSFTDGTTVIDDTFKIKILLGLVLETNLQLLVKQGEEKPITKSHLYAYNLQIPDPADIKYTITRPTVYGAILLNGEATTTFTQADIDAGLVTYKHGNNAVAAK